MSVTRLSHLFGFILVVFLFASCGVREGEIRINGTIEGLTQSDYPLLNIEGGSGAADTLHILNGDFNYEGYLEDNGIYALVYPNNTQLILWMHSGDHVTINGKAQDLWHLVVKGNEENELYNDFRQNTEANDTTSLRQEAARVIRQNPTSPVAIYLLTQYFIIPDDLPLDSINALYKTMLDAAPTNPDVASLGGKIQQRTALRVGQKMLNFDLVTTDSVHHRLQEYRGSTLFLYFWAGWQGSSSILHTELLRIKDKLEDPSSPSFKSVAILGYCLDVDQTTMEVNMSDDARKRIPTYCDYQGFNSPLVMQLGLKEVPFIVEIGPDGKIKRVYKDLGSLHTQYQ